MDTSRLILGIYLDPSIWVCNEGESINPDDMTPENCLKVVFSKKLQLDIEVCAQRQGFIIVSFSQAVLPDTISKIQMANLLPIKTAQFALSFFNAFLFLLHDQTLKHFEGKFHQMLQSVDISDIWRWDSEAGLTINEIAIKQPTPTMPQHKWLGMELATIMLLKTIGGLSETDRMMRFSLLSSIVNTSFDLLFSHDDINTNWQLLHMLNKSAYLIQKAEFAEAHVLSWSVAEVLIGIEWKNYISRTNETIDGKETITSKRLKDLVENGRDYSASVRAEILELAKVLPYNLYSKSLRARKVRNDWLHNLKPVTQEDCRECYIVARDLLSRKLGFTIDHRGAFYASDEHFRNIST